MGYLKIVIVYAIFTSLVLADTKSNKESNNTLLQWNKSRLFEIWNNITEGLSSFANVIASVQNVFSVLGDSSGLSFEDETIPQDTILNITELATKYGYQIENHQVITEDGYILTVHRLKGSNATRNKVVFLMHGIVDSSDSWILQGPDNALGYILADNGFDVWMGNARGNKHALAHTKLSPNESDFWDFTWEEIGKYDLPAMIDYALNVSESKSLHYVGYSQGTTSFYVMNSMKPEYNDKVKMMFSLAPVAWMSHVKSPLVRMFSPAHKILGYLLSNFNAKAPSVDFFNKIAAVFCSYLTIRCGNLLNMIGGFEYKDVNSTLIPVILGHMPTGASTLQFIHYGQLVQSGRFARFDYGESRNLKEYGQPSPPVYDVTKISVPIEIFFSDSDWLSAVTDVDTLKDELPNVIGYNFIKGFNHLDYTYASKAKNEVYNKIILKIHENEDYNKINYKTSIQNSKLTV